MTCKAKWRCEACGFCLDCTAGLRCAATGKVHRRPEPKKFIHRVQRTAAPSGRPLGQAIAPRKASEPRVERRPEAKARVRDSRAFNEVPVLPIGFQSKKEFKK